MGDDMPFTSIDSKPGTRHAFSNDALGNEDAVGLCQKLKRREVSPDEVLDAAYQRAIILNPALSAIAWLAPRDSVNARHTAKPGKHYPKFFEAIPTFVKDNISVSSMPTGFGTASFRATPEKTHSAYGKHFSALGMAILGKSSMPEFGFNATTEPLHTKVTRNPWNSDYSCGASSGGAATLVASGVVPFAHGNDGGGSIRIPAACCGLVGLKPSRGRHINELIARSLPINIISEGILSRSVRDTAYFHFEAQKYYHNKKLPPLPLVTTAADKRLRIGLFLDSVTGFSTDQETRRATLSIAERLATAGHHVEEIRFPVNAQFSEDFSLYWGMLAYLVKKTGKLTVNRHFDQRQLDPFSKGLARYYQKNMHRTPFILSRLKRYGHAFQAGFKHHDLYLSPVLSQTPRPIGELRPEQNFDTLFERLMRYASFTPMANIAGTPAIALPAGISREGLPIGIQLCAALGQEQTLLEIAYEIEALH